MMIVNLKLNSNGGILFFGYFSMLINAVMDKKGETLKFAKVLLLLLFDSLGHEPMTVHIKNIHQIRVALFIT